MPKRKRSAATRGRLTGSRVLNSALSAHPLVFRLPGSTWRRANASMMGGLKSPTMNRQDRQTRNAIKRNPSPNEIRPPTLGIGPKPQNDRIAKSKATIVHNVLKNIASLRPPISAALIRGHESAMVASRVGGAYDATTRSASCYIQTETLP